MQIVMFSKHLQELSVVDAGRQAKQLGFSGLDLTVRPGGHIEPSRAAAELPAAVRELKAAGVAAPMVSTGITTADDAADRLIGVIADQGIRELKLGYWPYRPFGGLRGQLDQARRNLEGLEALARKRQVRVSVHIHSGNYISAEGALLAELLKDRDPHHAGAYIDPGHMFIEGALGGWMQGLDLLRSYLSLVAVKSFVFISEDLPQGEKSWRPVVAPLKEGIVRWREVWPLLKQSGWDGVVTFHSEYQGRGSWRDLDLPQLIEQTRSDLEYSLPIIRKAGYRV